MNTAGPSTHDRTYRRTSCRGCGSRTLIPVIDLGEQPPSNNFIKPGEQGNEAVFPLVMERCPACGFAQLSHVVAASALFDDYAYLASASRPLREHYAALVKHLLAAFNPAQGRVVVDVGANDGILLNTYPSGRVRTVGIEPSTAGELAAAQGHRMIQRFLDEEAVTRTLSVGGPAALVTATNVFAHIDDLDSTVSNIHALLDAEDGVAVFEFSYLLDMVDHLYFDVIYHEHLSYLALTPLISLFKCHGMRIFDAERVAFGASGPALRIYACPEGAARRESDGLHEISAYEEAWGIRSSERYEEFALRVSEVRERLRAMLEGLRNEKRRLGAYTAPAKGNTLLNYLGFGPDMLLAVAETNERKIGKLTPGTHIPIVSEQTFEELRIDDALLLSWNYADFFLKNSAHVKRGGRFIVPLPEPRMAGPARTRENQGPT